MPCGVFHVMRVHQRNAYNRVIQCNCVFILHCNEIAFQNCMSNEIHNAFAKTCKNDLKLSF